MIGWTEGHVLANIYAVNVDEKGKFESSWKSDVAVDL